MGSGVGKSNIRVILIGGPPGAGKTTLGAALGSKLGIASLTVDDLVVAAKAVTAPVTHPGLWAMGQASWLEYFTFSSVEDLKADATLRHEAAWPMAKTVIQKHASGEGTPIVIDGWHLRPSYVATLDLDTVWPSYIVPEPAVLEARERALVPEVYGRAPDPERMLANFLARSHWFNALVEGQAAELGMQVLRRGGNVTVDELCGQVLDAMGPRSPRPVSPSG